MNRLSNMCAFCSTAAAADGKDVNVCLFSLTIWSIVCAAFTFSSWVYKRRQSSHLKSTSVTGNRMKVRGSESALFWTGGLLMFPWSGSWCHRCSLNSTSLYLERGVRFGGGVITGSCWQGVLFCQVHYSFRCEIHPPSSVLRGSCSQKVKQKNKKLHPLCLSFALDSPFSKLQSPT